MKLIGLMPVRNEAWVLGLSARVALKWCDELVCGIHACTDDSEKMLYGLRRDRITVRDLPGDSWDEMAHREALLKEARGRKATHIAIIDADEILTASLLPDIRDHIEAMPSHCILNLPGFNLRHGINSYHADGIWGNRWFSTAFADDPALSWTGDRFHHREPFGKVLHPFKPVGHREGGTMHLWGASERRLRAKSAFYKVTERLRWPDKPIPEIERMYNWAIHGEPGHPAFGTPETWHYGTIPASWWAPYADLRRYLDLDAEPWQEKAIIEAVKEHGPKMFQGLGLFGIA